MASCAFDVLKSYTGMKEINAKNIVWMGFGRVKTSGFLV